MATENNTGNVKYQLRFKANYISCAVKINGVLLYNTQDNVIIPEQLSFGQDVTQYLNQGDNELSISAINVAEYIPSEKIGLEYCEVDIIAIVRNELEQTIENKIVNNIRYNYQPKSEHSESVFPYWLSINESNKELDVNLVSQKINLTWLKDGLDANKEPVQRALATRSFSVNHHQPFSWVNDSTPFEDTPENKKMLWDKYQEILKAVANKDKKTVRKLVEPGVSDMAKHYGDSNADVQFEFTFEDTFQRFFSLNPNVYEAEPLTIDDYDLEIYADGKLFLLNRKNYPSISPLRWKNTVRGTTIVYTPVFTFIDGKIVMAWF